ncbi:MAG TPA: hypothetical protein PK251_07900 [Candidatus Latescibacteria bacterium]|nr:hypothetical protein [Candidatus Latescibacterota bacterium]HOF60942.1 hypothetical protein [Candidatus Latescibacterota bacterium]HOS64668.1 hypothetical protein [Candidatus Latescibacterota bacterium]HPK73664.1 hypothetical protein [Candidatus Latescibacterota bacterium]
MSSPEQEKSSPPPGGATSPYRRKAVLSFSVFGVFFIFYMGTAILQTPTFSKLAAVPWFGMPLGLLLSLLIFPVSWALIAIYFRLGR